MPYAFIRCDEQTQSALVAAGAITSEPVVMNRCGQRWIYIEFSDDEWKRRFWKNAEKPSVVSLLELITPDAPDWVVKSALCLSSAVAPDEWALFIVALAGAIDAPVVRQFDGRKRKLLVGALQEVARRTQCKSNE